VGLSWASRFVQRFRHYLDGFLEFPGYPGLPEQPPRPERLPAFLAEVQARRFDLAIQMHGSGALTNPLVALFGARCTAGWHVPGQFCPDAAWFLPYPEAESEVWRCLRLVEFLGAPIQDAALELPIEEQDVADLQAIEAARRLVPGGYVCLHPGARATTRRWLPERFAAVADGLAERGYPVVLTGSAAERPLAAAVSQAMRIRPIDLVGRTSFGALAALVRDARLVVCNDTGISHIAAALRVPSVIVVTASSPERWAPEDRQRHRVVAHPVACRPCRFDTCPIGFPCGTGVTEAAVLRAVDELLAMERVAPCG